MTEVGLWAAFGTGFIIGGIFGVCGVLAYGKQMLDQEQEQSVPPGVSSSPKPPYRPSGKGAWREP